MSFQTQEIWILSRQKMESKNNSIYMIESPKDKEGLWTGRLVKNLLEKLLDSQLPTPPLRNSS